MDGCFSVSTTVYIVVVYLCLSLSNALVSQLLFVYHKPFCACAVLHSSYVMLLYVSQCFHVVVVLVHVLNKILFLNIISSTDITIL